MASRGHGRDERPGEEANPGRDSSAAPNTDELFLDALRDSGDDDLGSDAGLSRVGDWLWLDVEACTLSAEQRRLLDELAEHETVSKVGTARG